MIEHIAGTHDSVTLKLIKKFDAKFVWVCANDEIVNFYESDTFLGLVVDSCCDEWWQGDFTLETLKKRCLDSVVDCDSGFGECLIIDNEIVACSPSVCWV